MFDFLKSFAGTSVVFLVLLYISYFLLSIFYVSSWDAKLVMVSVILLGGAFLVRMGRIRK